MLLRLLLESINIHLLQQSSFLDNVGEAVTDLTHKEILQPDAPMATVEQLYVACSIATIVVVVRDVEDVKSAMAIRILLCCKDVLNIRQIIKYSGAAFYVDATVDLFKLGNLNDSIAIVVEAAEGCHLPLIYLALSRCFSKHRN
jgi:hypothetical protein